MKDFRKRTVVAITLIYLSLIVFLLAGCGGGGSSATGAGSSVSAYSAGTVTGFGSIIIDGVSHDDSIAQVNQEINPNMLAAATTTSVRLGMNVETMLDGQGRITRLSIQSEVLGTIIAIASDGFTVAGQTVKVSGDVAAPTVFEGANSLADLIIGDLVEVHGSRDASGNIIATRVERRDPNSTVGVRVAGTLSNLDLTAKTFTIAALTVNYGSATLLPVGSTLAVGQRVAVWSDTAVSDNTLVAKAVRIKTTQLVDGSSVSLGGRISGIVLTPLTFSLGDVTVDASKAVFANGSAADLANGSLVRVTGAWEAGQVAANQIYFVKERTDATVRLTGAVTDFLSLSSFKLRGVTVDASAVDIAFTGGDADNLADGVMVRIEGTINGGVVNASSVEFVTVMTNGRDNENRTFPGTVSSYDAESGAFTLANINLAMQINAATKITNADGSDAPKENFAVGKRVLVRGSFVNGVLAASEVRIIPAGGLISAHVEGALYGLNMTESSFKMNGATIFYGDDTAFENGLQHDMANGVRVHVTARLLGGIMVASRIEIQHSNAEMVGALGSMNGFTSSANFMVAGQMVDASGSDVKFVNGSAADMGRGRMVSVSGALIGGKLVASRLEFKD
ncbi:MAG: DUF5666 domain-containing protein [Syntrophales bacterium]|nr:DUF5666 domain-containing protein [Syntrophales bacterium]